MSEARAFPLPAPTRTKQRRLYSRWSSAGGAQAAAAAPSSPPPPPPPREKQLSENLQRWDISALATERTLITDVNAAFVGGKASGAHLLWRLGCPREVWHGSTVGSDGSPSQRAPGSFGFGWSCERPSVETRERQRRHFRINVFTRLQTASNEGKQSKPVQPGWRPVENPNIRSGQMICARWRARSCFPQSQQQTGNAASASFAVNQINNSPIWLTTVWSAVLIPCILFCFSWTSQKHQRRTGSAVNKGVRKVEFWNTWSCSF